MFKALLNNETSHKQAFAIMLWVCGVLMTVFTFAWSLFYHVGDAEMIKELIWSAYGAGAFLSGATIFDKYKSFKKEIKEQ